MAFNQLARLLILTAFALASCASPSPGAASARQTGAATATSGGDAQASTGASYRDAKLGFSLRIPAGWTAQAQPGRRGSAGASALNLIGSDQTTAHRLVTLGVIAGGTMAAEFAERGTPTTQIGPYPAFSADRGAGEARVPCLVRLFLAAPDYVVAAWCSLDAFQHRQEFERLLATFLPAPNGFVSHPAAAPAPATCAEVQAAFGYPATSPQQPMNWGRQLATPSANAPVGGWNQATPGAYVCSNTGSADQYLFQCTELINRYLYEQWALPHLPGNAARYYDYYQDGALRQGVIRDLPASAYQLSDDASQGVSAFAPQPGDLLVFQDVRDPQRGWISGLTTSPGHVALITGVAADHVIVAQENYNDRQYFEELTMTHDARGYHIVDRSGLPDRITRGWIHLMPNGAGEA